MRSQTTFHDPAISLIVIVTWHCCKFEQNSLACRFAVNPTLSPIMSVQPYPSFTRLTYIQQLVRASVPFVIRQLCTRNNHVYSSSLWDTLRINPRAAPIQSNTQTSWQLRLPNLLNRGHTHITVGGNIHSQTIHSCPVASHGSNLQKRILRKAFSIDRSGLLVSFTLTIGRSIAR